MFTTLGPRENCAFFADESLDKFYIYGICILAQGSNNHYVGPGGALAANRLHAIIWNHVA